MIKKYPYLQQISTKAVAQAVTEYDVRHDGVGHYLEDHWFSVG